MAQVTALDVAQEYNFVVLTAVVDGVRFDSDDYAGDLVEWMQAILNHTVTNNNKGDR